MGVTTEEEEDYLMMTKTTTKTEEEAKGASEVPTEDSLTATSSLPWRQQHRGKRTWISSRGGRRMRGGDNRGRGG